MTYITEPGNRAYAAVHTQEIKEFVMAFRIL
jgi:hypothetical protein